MKSQDLDALKKKFIEEATDHIGDLEEALMALEKNPDDQEHIERTFRAMHSLKGGGAMFGFTKVSELTHNLETIYDKIRNQQAKLNDDILTITFESVDFLKKLLYSEEDDQEIQDEQTAFLEKINQLLSTDNNATKTKEGEKKTAKEATIKTFYIFFKPDPRIFDNGTNPLFLLDELASLGQCKAMPRYNILPAFHEMDPTTCYTHWEIFLVTEEDISSIQDVFIFVEDDCELDVELLHTGNLFENNKFNEELTELINTDIDAGIDKVKKMVTESVPKTTAPGKKNPSAKNGKENQIASIRVASDKLDSLMNLVSELVTTQARLNLYTEQDSTPELTSISESIQKLTRQLRDLAFSIVLIPIENMLTRFHRLIRDLSKELGKDINFTTEGAETELDKNIIDNLSDPMMHILRNSIDHGIEDDATRKKNGKPEKGQINLKAYYSGSNVNIQVSDDGAGINPEKIRQKAIQKGIITAETTLSQREVFDLLFQPGFSTSENVTDVSGRGVGMDVVKRKIEEVRGEIEMSSEPGKGTTIIIKLPLTLSIIDGLLVQIDSGHYIVPLSAIVKIYAVQHEEVVNQFNNLVVLDGEQIPFFYLRKEFEVEESNAHVEQVIVVSYEDKKIGLVVDEVIGEYQAVLKPLGKHYKDQEMVSGASILGDGTVALVLDTNKMVSQLSHLQKEKANSKTE